MMTSTLRPVIITISLTVILTTAFPTHFKGPKHIKVDPFEALAQSLRQEDLQQQQQRRPIRHRTINEADYDNLQRPNEDPIDLWQVRQLQHQMGQAAMMMPMFNRQQTNWAIDDEVDQLDDYGVPVLSEEEMQEGQLYRESEEPIYNYFSRNADNEYSDEDTEEAEEKRLLMDTLAEYMYLSGNADHVKRSNSDMDNRKVEQREMSLKKQLVKLSNGQQMDNQLQQSEEQHIVNPAATSKGAAAKPEDELIQQLDTLKT